MVPPHRCPPAACASGAALRAVDNRNLTRERKWQQPLHYRSMHQAFLNHTTVVAHAVQRLHKGVRRLTDGLEAFFRLRVGANMYFSPPHSVGLPPHWDLTDVIVLQVRTV